MTSEEQLRARLRKIEALFAGAATPGERLAAEAALARIKAASRRRGARPRPSSCTSASLTLGHGNCSSRLPGAMA